jgi:hypothetical protein
MRIQEYGATLDDPQNDRRPLSISTFNGNAIDLTPNYSIMNPTNQDLTKMNPAEQMAFFMQQMQQ